MTRIEHTISSIIPSAASEPTLSMAQSLVEKMPAWGNAQAWLASQNQSVGQNALQKQRAALNFGHPLWLHFLLEEENNDTITPFEKEEITTVATVNPIIDTEENIIPNSEKTTHPIITNTASEITSTGEEKGMILTQHKHTVTIEPENTADTVGPVPPEEKPTQPEDSEDEVPSRLTHLLQAQADAFKKETVTDKDVLLPLPAPTFTKDYFKSQGILLSGDNGEFTGKIRKFTDWIKQMKRINPNPIDLGSELEEEAKIVADASLSNRKEDVLTEAMADVLVKQGKKEEAQQLFEKLSLQNPAKSAYFADKINSLKQI